MGQGQGAAVGSPAVGTEGKQPEEERLPAGSSDFTFRVLGSTRPQQVLQALFDRAEITEPVSWLRKGLFLLVIQRCFIASDYCQLRMKVELLNVWDVFLTFIFSSC